MPCCFSGQTLSVFSSGICWPGEFSQSLLLITSLCCSETFSIALGSQKIDYKACLPFTSSVSNYVPSREFFSSQWFDSPFPEPLPLASLCAHASASTHGKHSFSSLPVRLTPLQDGKTLEDISFFAQCCRLSYLQLPFVAWIIFYRQFELCRVHDRSSVCDNLDCFSLL